MITLGLSEIKVGIASPEGVMPTEMEKIGKTYRDSCKISQDSSEVTEHFEEGKSTPESRAKTKKIPSFTFSIMDPDIDMMAKYVGGTVTGSKWGFNGNEAVSNASFSIIPEQGIQFDIPNGDVDCVINDDASKKGIFLLDFTVTPMAVSGDAKALQAFSAPVDTGDGE